LLDRVGAWCLEQRFDRQLLAVEAAEILKETRPIAVEHESIRKRREGGLDLPRARRRMKQPCPLFRLARIGGIDCRKKSD
jgi:hypothetical protein